MARILLEPRQPDAFLHEIAKNLQNLSAVYIEAGRPDDALAYIREALTTYQTLAPLGAKNFRKDQILCLTKASELHIKSNRIDIASDLALNALASMRELATEEPLSYCSDWEQVHLACILVELGTRHNLQGANADALSFYTEALKIFRSVSIELPDAICVAFATCLLNLAPLQHGAGNLSAALALAGEAVGLYRGLVSRQGEKFLADLALSLNNLGPMQSDSEMIKDGLRSSGEAVELYRSLVLRWPGQHEVALAMSLGNLSSRQFENGLIHEGFCTGHEAINIYRRFGQQSPLEFEQFAIHLYKFSLVHLEFQKLDEALEFATEALNVIWPSFAQKSGIALSITPELVEIVMVVSRILGRSPSPDLIQRIKLISPHLNTASNLEGRPLPVPAVDLEQQPSRERPAIGRNEPCPCGSGKLYKKCHGA